MGLSNLKPFFIGPYAIKVPIVLAPMAGVSEMPFRLIAREMGAGFATTELVSAKALLQPGPHNDSYLRHDEQKERPFSVQVFGGDPETMAKGAEILVERGADIIDINMGCPVKKVTKKGAGSALLADPNRAAAIIRAVRSRIGDGHPVSVKIRSGWDRQNATEVGRRLEDAGASAIAIHARTKEQGYSGCADWTLIRSLREVVSIPVIANGDITSVKSANQVVEETGCAAVMIGRGALGNPWIFQGINRAWANPDAPPPEGPSAKQRADLIKRHLLEEIAHIRDERRALHKFRQHLIWYSRGLEGGVKFRDEVVRIEETEEVLTAIERFFEGAQTLEATAPEEALYDERRALG